MLSGHIKKVREEILAIITQGAYRVPVSELEKAVSNRLGVDRRAVKAAVRSLVEQGRVTYTNLFGTNFLEPSLERAVAMSRRIVVKPPRIDYVPREKEVVLDMAKGAAFGDGGHATTQLVLQALDRVLDRGPFPGAGETFTGLDVGTGSGILAIALAKLGARHVLGTDIDPCALCEAKENVHLNCLEERVAISDAPLEQLEGGYGIVLANLAWPSIKAMSRRLVSLTAPGGVMILSGFRESAAPAVEAHFKGLGLRLAAATSARQWACVTWHKPR